MLKDFNAVKITVASPQDIMNWSFGEVTKPETINYRTYRSEPQGLMAEEIFGPTKDFECYCGKYKKIRYKGIVCDRCGVEVTHKRVRRERMGHIKLAAPVAHVWFSNGLPNKMALILDIPQKKLETVIYYARYVVTGVNEEQQKESLESLPKLREEVEKDLLAEQQEKTEEAKELVEEEIQDIKKEIKDEKKQKLQIERKHNNEKVEIARINAAYKQKIDATHKQFDSMKALINSIREGFTLSEEEHQMLEEYDMFFYDASMGAEAIKELLEKMNITEEVQAIQDEMSKTKSKLKKSRLIQRLRVLKGIEKSGMKPEWLILEVLPVIPPDIRPIIQLPGGRFATYDLNDLYRRVINRNNRLQRLINLGAPEIILRNEKRMLQESVDSLIDNNHKPGAPALNNRQMPYKSLSDMLRGKQGRFRQNLLGKRVDYSGRAVIVAGPGLRFDQCGLPKNIALEIFKPFILRELIERGHAANPNRAKMIFESQEPLVWDILEEVIVDRPVLLNRAPSLHRYSILAFYPILIEGNAIRLHPMVCKGFNADFDGDQMAVHLPLSDAAVQEAKERMFPKDNMLTLRDGTPIVNVEKDMAKGVFFLTNMNPELKEGSEEAKKVRKFGNEDELFRAYDLGLIKFYEPVQLIINDELVLTTIGRVMLNKTLPEEFEYVNKALSKSDIAGLTAKIFREYGNEKAIESLDLIKDLGFKFATKLGFSISMGDFNFENDDYTEDKLAEFDKKEEEILANYYEGMITQKELQRLKQVAWLDATEEIQEGVWSLAQKSKNSLNLINLDKSGAVPVSAWFKQISGARGTVSDMEGNIVNLPLKGNFEKGLNNFEYFVAAKAVRKSFSDVALKTANSGYLTRRLVDVAQDVVTVTEDNEADENLVISKNDEWPRPFEKRILGRTVGKDVVVEGKTIAKRNDLIDGTMAKSIAENDKIESMEVRSPLTSKMTHGISQYAYGVDNGTGKLVKKGEAVGIIAAQSLGEPTTQLTLKSKSDARATKADVTQGLPRVEELLEARTPKALALLADFDGEVTIKEERGKVTLRIAATEKQVKEYDLGEGDQVIAADKKTAKKADTLIVRADKSEVKAPFKGKVKIDSKNGKFYITADKIKEVEKKVANASELIVENGDKVTKGQQLSHGSKDPKELAKLKGILEAQLYIIAEVQKVYAIHGSDVDDRHLEIMARQMGRFGLISDAGDSDEYLPGDYADFAMLETANAELEAQGKKKIQFERVLLGITQSSIRTESFLSAASFQQQVRVLTDAALIGKVDHLRGLKENVIIGRPVPIGKVLETVLEQETFESTQDDASDAEKGEVMPVSTEEDNLTTTSN